MQELTTPELAEKLGVSQGTIKVWEQELGIRVPRGSRNRRKYDQNLIALFETIKDLRDQGDGSLTIRRRIKDKIDEASSRYTDGNDDDPNPEYNNDAQTTPVVMELLRQLEIKDAEIARLNKELRAMSEVASQFRERSDNLGQQIKLLSAPKDEPKSIWRRVFGG